MRRLIMLMSLVAMAGGLQARAEVSASAKPAAVQQRVLQLVNEARARGRRCGREYFAPTAALGPSERLAKAARAHAQDMATNNYFSHTSKDGRSFVDRIKAQGYPVPRSENIAAGQPTVTAVMDAWMASSGHRANILDCSAVAMGAASATGGSYGIYWVQDFGR